MILDAYFAPYTKLNSNVSKTYASKKFYTISRRKTGRYLYVFWLGKDFLDRRKKKINWILFNLKLSGFQNFSLRK